MTPSYFAIKPNSPQLSPQSPPPQRAPIHIRRFRLLDTPPNINKLNISYGAGTSENFTTEYDRNASSSPELLHDLPLRMSADNITPPAFAAPPPTPADLEDSGFFFIPKQLKVTIPPKVSSSSTSDNPATFQTRLAQNCHALGLDAPYYEDTFDLGCESTSGLTSNHFVCTSTVMVHGYSIPASKWYGGTAFDVKSAREDAAGVALGWLGLRGLGGIVGWD
jgi:hypothetical protein